MATAVPVHETKHLTIHFEESDGWVTAQIEEEPAAISQGRTEEEAYANVLEALRDLRHEPTFLERCAYTLQARLVEPLREHLQDRAHRRLTP